MDSALIVTRLLQFAAGMVVCGSSLYFAYGYRSPPGQTWPGRLVAGFALIGALGAVGWLMAQSAAFGDSVADAFAPGKVWAVAWETSFGPAAAGRAAGFLLIAAASPLIRRPRTWLGLGLAGAAIVASFAWTGHGGAGDGLAGAAHRAADIVHLLAAAVWLGALAPLGVQAIRCGGHPLEPELRAAHLGLTAFSGIGPVVVALLVASGLANTWFLVGPSQLTKALASPYGLALAAKLVVFALMLLLAVHNRYVLTPRIGRAIAEAGAEPGLASTAMGRSVLAETALAGLVLLLVSALGALQPPAAG